MTIAAILDKQSGDVVTAAPGMTVREVVRLLAQKRIGAVPVVEGQSVAGVMSERDVIYCIEANGEAILDWPVERIMTSPAITVERSESVMHALSLMTRRRIRHLPVVEGDRLVGIVSIGDLVKYRMDKIESDAQAMLSYIQSA